MKIEFPTTGKTWLEAANANRQPGAKIIFLRAGRITLVSLVIKTLRTIRIIAGVVIIVGGIHLAISEEGAWGLTIYLGCILTWIAVRSSRQRGLQLAANNEFAGDLESEFFCSYELRADQLQYEDPRQIIAIPWRQIIRVVQTQTLLAIVDSVGRVFGIPNQAFAGTITREQFVDQLLTYARADQARRLL